MKPALDFSKLREIKPRAHLLRFGFGGVITVATGLIAHAFGAGVGGLFLAFPAILPATLTLVKKHDGRKQAVQDSHGATVGSVGLLAFAVVIAALSERAPPAAILGIAGAAWLAVSISLWWILAALGMGP